MVRMPTMLHARLHDRTVGLLDDQALHAPPAEIPRHRQPTGPAPMMRTGSTSSILLTPLFSLGRFIALAGTAGRALKPY
ncbi:MAG: hypothetical protein WDN69_32660 [Aliidongia sp.]